MLRSVALRIVLAEPLTVLPQGIWQAARAALPPADISLDQLTNEKG